MGFMKEFVIYEKGKTKVYINQCHNKGKKTKLFSIRRDDEHGLCWFLGIIKFYGAWRQYATMFEPDTIWGAACKRKICEFEEMLNKKFREGHRKCRKR